MYEDLENSVIKKINEGKSLITVLESRWKNVEGVQKLQRKIRQELNFLHKISQTRKVKKEHLQCSNLTHFGALVSNLNQVENCTSVSKVFTTSEKRLTVDIVCDGGLSWIKVIARNPRSLNQVCMGDASYGVRSILDQAQEFLDSAKLFPCLFQTPKVMFSFENGVGATLATKLEHLGVKVEGTKLDDLLTDLEIDEDEDCNIKRTAEVDLSFKYSEHMIKVNLDVSAMLAYVSNMTNGSPPFQFRVPVLTQQAIWERKRPVKAVLDALFKGKRLYCCQTAKINFDNIVYTVGGPTERIRAEEFMKRVQVLPDDASVADIIEEEKECSDSQIFDNIQYVNKVLKVGGKIKERSLIIFAFGDRIQAMTATANDGFVRAAKQKGVNFVVFVHESRALSEEKEPK